MRAAVIGLGVEGKKATKSLLDYGWHVYATDLETDIDLEELNITAQEANFFTDNDKLTITTDNLIVELGYNDEDIIASCDAIVLSPGLWKTELAKKFKNSGKLINDILTDHKNTLTIGITGTNGKTTTCHMLKEILDNTNKKILLGGNAGGGFNGYCDIILEAEKENYDIIIVEVCDMTLNFADYTFDFDIVGLTNIGNDHMNVHGSIENYKNSVLEFFKNKVGFVDEQIEYLEEFKKIEAEEEDGSTNIRTFSEYSGELRLFGKFNRFNAGLASAISKCICVDANNIEESLKNVEPVEGRLKTLKLNDSTIFIGKTDNSHAIKSLLEEQNFYATFIGTPRHNEEHRFDILNEVAYFNPEVIVLFPGLDDTVDHALYRLNSIGYEGRVEIANSLDEIIALLAEYSHENAIFIGGNGQDAIIEIQKRLELLCGNCS